MAEGGRRRVPALTVENILVALRGIEGRWYGIGGWLYVPQETRREIRSQHSTDSDRLRAVLLYVLTLHPRSSWRCAIRALHGMEEHQVAERIQDYSEPVTDPTLTVERVADVFSLLKRNWYDLFPEAGDSLCGHLKVPKSKQREIKSQRQSQQLASLSAYIVQFIPGISWAVIAGALYYCCEERALQAANRCIKREKDSTLTVPHLLSALQGVSNWKGLGQWLDVPWSRRDVMTGIESMLEEWLQNHPSPSWKLVAWALYQRWECNLLKRLYGKYVNGPEIERKLSTCREAIKEKGAIDQTVMQGIFFGLPRSGKTSTKKRLVGKKPAVEQTSTGVAEKVSRVEIEKSTVQLLSHRTWNEVTELNDETALVIEEIVDHVAANDLEVNDGASANVSQVHRVQNAAAPKDGPIQIIVKKVKALFTRKRKDAFELADLVPAQEDVTHSQLQVLSRALQTSSSSMVIVQRGENQWTIYISDAGGQPEFQEMLPALVSGPSLYFLTFSLHKGLNEKFLVEYQHPDGRLIVPFQDSFTVKEVLLQSLASIASTKSYIRVDNGKPVTPKVLFIATHRDKLQSEQQLMEIDKELQEIVKRTAAFKENMIVFHSEEQMVFALDNTSDDSTDIQHVRDAVERIGIRGEEYKIQTPYTWMIFAITLRHLQERVLSIDKCMEIGKECGIESLQELRDALWFLHHNVGIVRHFQEHPDLQNVVIKEPQYIFDKVTELIVDTFTFEHGTAPYELEEFSKKGIFPADAVRKSSTEPDTFTGERFGDLLEHLHIVAPIKEGGKVVKYFAPVALTHADLPPNTQTEEVIPSVYIVFESGFCPKGMFGALVVDLLKTEKQSNFEWTLKEDRIYRDQLCLAVGPYDSFRFSLSPTCIKISLSTTISHDRKVCLGAVCCDVRREIESSIRSVTKALHYTQRASHSLAFACPEPPPHDQSHAATINFSHTGEPCTMTCQLTRKLYPDLPDGHTIWFDENVCLPPKVSCPAQATSTDSADNLSDFPTTSSRPKLHHLDLIEANSPSDFPTISSLPVWHHLDLIEANGKMVRVIKQAAAKWESVATRLYFGFDDISRIKRDVHYQSIDACQTVFTEWLQGNGRKPTTWSTVIKVLEEAELSELAADLKTVLSTS